MKLDNETQSFKVWPKPFKKLFTLSGSSLQKIKNFKIYKLKSPSWLTWEYLNLRWYKSIKLTKTEAKWYI